MPAVDTIPPASNLNADTVLAAVDTATQIMADLTTTATGATNVGIGVKEMYDLLKPSASLARGTKELQSAIFLLRDEKFNIPSTVVLELWIKYER